MSRNENMCMVLLTFAGAFSLCSGTGSPDPFIIPCSLCHGGSDPLFPISQGSRHPGPGLRGVPIPCSQSQDSFKPLFFLRGIPVPCSLSHRAPNAQSQQPQHLSIARVMDAVLAATGASSCQCWPWSGSALGSV